MEFFRSNTQIDFLKIRAITGFFSILMCVLAGISLGVKGLHWGLDFTGGVLMELHYQTPVDLEPLRGPLQAAGFSGAVLQHAGSTQDVLLRLPHSPDPEAEKRVGQQVRQALETIRTDFAVKRMDAIGSHVGRELATQGFWAIVVALGLMGIYIALRFEYRFAVAAAVALAHDPIIIMGVFSWWEIEFDLTTLAAILAVIGYSLNDTIVVFDRVKENFLSGRQEDPRAVVNTSINQTLSRTVMTSLATLWVVLALLVWGGPSLWGFSLALLIGIVVGTYSSIYIAGVLAVVLGLQRAHFLRHQHTNRDRHGASSGAVV